MALQGLTGTPEVAEFMVRKLDGSAHPALLARVDSGVSYDGRSGRWTAESTSDSNLDYEAIYAPCIQAQHSFIAKTNQLCAKRKVPPLDVKALHSWSDVEESVLSTCSVLDRLSSQDQAPAPGFTGKVREAYRKLCRHAGAGTTLTNLVPSDSYFSVLCGGLKIIFNALEQTGYYRQEIYGALEELPGLLTDHAEWMDIFKGSEEMHRRVAGLYEAVYELMEVIVSWFLKRSRVTAVKMLVNPTGFSDSLKDSLSAVKLASQKFTTYTAIISTRNQQNLAQDTHSILYMQHQGVQMQHVHSQQMAAGLSEINARLVVLEVLGTSLQTQLKASNEREDVMAQRAAPALRITAAPVEVDVDEILETFQYDPDLVPKDCQNVARYMHKPGIDVDEERIASIQAQPRFRAWLTLDESSILLINASSESPASSFEMSIVTAMTYEHVLRLAEEQDDSWSVSVVPLVFFCGKHRDFHRDVHGNPAEMAMCLLLQLVDRYRDFDSRRLASVVDKLDPTNIESICTAIGRLLSRLPSSVILVLMVDGLYAFAQPPERREGTLEVVARLVDIHHETRSQARLKFLFTNQARSGFVDGLFTEDELLRIPL